MKAMVRVYKKVTENFFVDDAVHRHLKRWLDFEQVRGTWYMSNIYAGGNEVSNSDWDGTAPQ